MTLRVYYRRFGEVPSRVTPQVYADAYGEPLEEVEPLMVELLRSPLTGEYPRTDAREFSRGDLFVKTLSDEEMRHFAAIHPFYSELWYNGRARSTEGEWMDMPLSGPVWYVRLYGLSDVIYNALRFGGVVPMEYYSKLSRPTDME